jgi:serine/threonine protein kinase
MSPEQIDGKPLDRRTDIFNLGMLLYRLLAGAHPHFSREAGKVLPAVDAQEPPPLAEAEGRPEKLMRRLDPVVRKALQTDRRRRYDDVEDFRRDFLRAFETRVSVLRVLGVFLLVIILLLAAAVGVCFLDERAKDWVKRTLPPSVWTPIFGDDTERTEGSRLEPAAPGAPDPIRHPSRRAPDSARSRSGRPA